MAHRLVEFLLLQENLSLQDHSLRLVQSLLISSCVFLLGAYALLKLKLSVFDYVETIHWVAFVENHLALREVELIELGGETREGLQREGLEELTVFEKFREVLKVEFVNGVFVLLEFYLTLEFELKLFFQVFRSEQVKECH